MQPMYPPPYEANEGSSIAVPLLIGVGVVGLLGVGGYFAYTQLSATKQSGQVATQNPFTSNPSTSGQTPSGQTPSGQQQTQTGQDPYATSQQTPQSDYEEDPQSSQSASQAGWPSGKFAIAAKSNEGYVIDIPKGSSVIGTNLVMWKDYGSDNQRFTYDSSTKQIKTKDNLVFGAGLPLPSPGNSGDRINQTFAFENNPRQRWEYNQSTGEIKLDGTNLCLDMSGGNATEGTELIVWDCHGKDNQKWKLKQ